MATWQDPLARAEPPCEESVQARCAHNLNPHFGELSAFDSTRALHAAQIYKRLRSVVEPLLIAKEYVELAPAAVEAKTSYRFIAWNVERGIHYEGIRHLLASHPSLREGDVFLLTETDLGMARSGNRHIARELAEALQLNYYFVPSYLNLCKGNGAEDDIEGENTLAMHGNAILSRYPLTDLDLVALPNGKDKMRGKEKRIGCQKALLATVQCPGKPVRVACVHLDAHSSQRHRALQMRRVLDALDSDETKGLTSIIGGDWNTSTYNSSRAFYAICGFWYRVAMGVHHVMTDHYPHPYRKFERELFGLLKSRGFDYERCNELGVGTNHYHVDDFKQYRNLSDWIPQWCFHFIEWALRPHGGRCSFKIDWFATRGAASINAKVVSGLTCNGHPVSDHDAIVLDIGP